MKGNTAVIQALQHLLEGELAAIDQYFVHARIYDDMGYEKLGERLWHESGEERTHADAIIKRMLFLEAKPDLSKRDPIKVGDNVRQMMQNDLAWEIKVQKRLVATIKICEENKDFQSREVLQQLLSDTEEDHIYWLEKQLRLIDAMGLENYLQSQI